MSGEVYQIVMDNVRTRMSSLSTLMTGIKMRVEFTNDITYAAFISQNKIFLGQWAFFSYDRREGCSFFGKELDDETIKKVITKSKALTFHETAHKLFDKSLMAISDKKSSRVMKILGLTQDQYKELKNFYYEDVNRKLQNTLEDQRIENLLVELYPNVTSYLTSQTLGLIVKDAEICKNSDKIFQTFLLVWGRKFIPLDIRMKLLERCRKFLGNDIDKIKDKIDEYIQISSMDVMKIIKVVSELKQIMIDMGLYKVIKVLVIEHTGKNVMKVGKKDKIRIERVEVSVKKTVKEDEEEMAEEAAEDVEDEEPIEEDVKPEEPVEEVVKKELEPDVPDEELAKPKTEDIIEHEKSTEVDDDEVNDEDKDDTTSNEDDKVNELGEKEEDVEEEVEDKDDEKVEEDTDIERQEGPETVYAQDDEEEPEDDEEDEIVNENLGEDIEHAYNDAINDIEVDLRAEIRRVKSVMPPPVRTSQLDVDMASMLKKKLRELTAGLEEKIIYNQTSGRLHGRAIMRYARTGDPRIFKKRLDDSTSLARMAVSIIIDASGSMGGVTADGGKLNSAVRAAYVLANEMEKLGHKVMVRAFGNKDVLIKGFNDKGDWSSDNFANSGYGNSDTRTSIVNSKIALTEIMLKEDIATGVLFMFGDGEWDDSIKSVNDWAPKGETVERYVEECRKADIITCFLKYAMKDDFKNLEYRYGISAYTRVKKNCDIYKFILMSAINTELVKVLMQVVAEIEKQVVIKVSKLRN
jgi:hypothetical protein